MSGTKRGLRTALGASAACAVAALGVLGSGAAAVAAQQSDPNPLSTNVPYLAWRGEHVRLVTCEGDLPGADMESLRAAPRSPSGGLDLGVRTDVIVEDWSGNADFKPAVAPGTVDLFLTGDGLCVKADVLSQYAGLAQIKLMVTLDPGRDSGFADILTRSEILGVHQFLSGWMTLGTPTLASRDVGGELGNPNNYDAGDAPSSDGVLDVHVNGTLPLGNSFADLGLGATLTLPDQWPDLAGKLAGDRNPDNADPAYRWDIHDSDTPEEGHVQYGPVTTADGIACNDAGASTADLARFGDAVDNCEGGLSFSRWFDADGPAGPLTPISLGRTDEPTIGPFDPQRPDETLLGDGFLTADDAPMPAARIDVSIAANSGAATDTSGIGALHRNDKQQWFSRDRLPGANAGSGSASPHNLSAPFSSAYVPATADGSWLLDGTPVSGTDGPAMGNDFPGFLVGDGNGGEGDYADVDNTYNYWDVAHVFRSGVGAETTCLNRDDREPTQRLLPEGAQSVAVYTDEHGEAQVDYRPGTGAYYDNIAGIIRNANGGCDLKNVDVLGTSAISATARYPYQPTTDVAAKTSPTVVKTVHSLFAKFLTQWPKGEGDDNAVTRIIVAHAQDVDGSPYAGEKVCFVKGNPNGTYLPYVYNGHNDRFVGGYDLYGSTQVKDKLDDVLCMRTNDAGNAAIEVVNSDPTVADVVADFTAEAIRREYRVDFGRPIPSPQPEGPGPSSQPSDAVTPPPAGAAGNAAPSAATSARVDEVVAAASKPAVAGAKKGAVCVVRFARLKTSAKGKRSLVVRLDGGTAATVRIKLFDKKGKARAKVVRRIAAGRTVTVTGLTISKQITRASLKVIG